MPRQAHYRSANIRLSFQRVLGNSLEVDTVGADGSPISLTVPIKYESPWSDEDGMQSPLDTPDRAFVTVVWIEEMAGRGGDSLVQLDIWCRVGDPTEGTSDPQGIIVDDITDEIEDLFAGNRDDGTKKAWHPIYDFSDPNDPQELGEGKCILVGYGFGRAEGQPSSRRRYKREGLNRVAIAYPVKVVTDLLSHHDYADG